MPALTDTVVIVTGASSGIGAATAGRLAASGAKVVATARRADRIAEIPAGSGEILPVAADLSEHGAAEWIVEAALHRFGRVDALVNNAGAGLRGPVELLSLDAVRKTFETNLFGALRLVQLVAPGMRERRAGRIVNVGSVAGRIARPTTSTYDATKHAMEAFTDGLRGELAPFGVHVVMIRPGFVRTDLFAASAERSAAVMEHLGDYGAYIRPGRGAAPRIAAEPDRIAALIERALTADRPRGRYAAPLHAHVALALRRVLPERAFDVAGRLRTR